MSDEVYYQLAKVLDTLPNGFPGTPDGLEIKLLKKIFDPEEAVFFRSMRLKFETPDQIAKRVGRPLEEIDPLLARMKEKGQIFGVDLGGQMIYKMLPWVFGIFEMQLNRLDLELVQLTEAYGKCFGKQFFSGTPQLMQTIPIERHIPVEHQALPYEMVSKIIEKNAAFAVADCICKKEKAILGHRCDKPMEVCLAFAPIPGIFDSGKSGRVISKEEAYEVLRISEEAGLVHLTYNFQDGHYFICNCCGCCCGVLRAFNELGVANVTNSHFYAEIDPDECAACGVCADERCQVHAIEEGEDAYRVVKESCIGCGLCVSTCPTGAIKLVRRPEAEIQVPPTNEVDWFEQRGRRRGVDFSEFK